MIAKLCDACGKVLKEKDIYEAPCMIEYFELCKDCKEKFDKIKNDYNNKLNELENKHKELTETFKNNLKEMGIDIEKEYR